MSVRLHSAARNHMELILDRYKPLDEAGIGAFGTVQLAWDTRIQRRVAIKTIQLNDAELDMLDNLHVYDESDTKDFHNAGASTSIAHDELDAHWLSNISGLDEARTAAMLTDNNIVTVYDFQIVGDIAYLIMEYVDGPTLGEFVRQHNEQISLDMITSVLEDIAHALEIAHKNGVLHLDIKPDNVLINKAGVAKVTDFGLATLADAQGYGLAGGGTIGYMPLEQMNQENLDARCDLWALASIAYELLSGANPFIVQSLEKAPRAILDAELVVPSVCWNGLNEDVDDIIFDGLAPDRNDRYDSVAEFADDLLSLLGDAKKGRKQISALIDTEEYGNEVLEQKIQRGISNRTINLVRCICSGIGCAIFGAVGLLNIGVTSGYTNPWLWVGTAICFALGAIKADIGVVAASVLFGAALCINKIYVVGSILIVFSIVWWITSGRKNRASAECALVFPVGGLIWCAPIGVIASSIALRLRDAITTVVFGLCVSTCLASFGSDTLIGWFGGAFINESFQGEFFRIVGQLSFWCLFASWIIAVATGALVSSPFSLIRRVFAVIVASVCTIGGLFLSAFVASNFVSWSVPVLQIATTTISCVIVFIACFFTRSRIRD